VVFLLLLKIGEIKMAELISKSENEIVLQVKVKLSGSLIEMEENIQKAVNEIGILATKEAIKKFDTTGAPIQIAGVRLTSKGNVSKMYETPYGSVNISRHVYQTANGGKTYCPLDEKARIITSSTPRFAKMLTHKYVSLSAREVHEDLEKNHGRSVAKSFIQNVIDVVGSIAQATEEEWMYETPKQNELVETIALSLDGTCVLMREDGWREAMTATISLYNKHGDRLYSIYLGAAPEYGKEKFLLRFEKEIYAIKLQYPQVKYIGLADGAKTNWEFLEKHTAIQILDFYHATEYLAKASCAVHPSNYAIKERKEWLEEACHKLKHHEYSVSELLKEMENLPKDKLSFEIETKLNTAITYFKNQKHRMNYAHYQKENLPIGSGVTEAACKTLVKQRLCQSGMKWGSKGASIVLCLRALLCTVGRFEQFWERINLAGFSGLAEIH
jgi:hypothetical protein